MKTLKILENFFIYIKTLIIIIAFYNKELNYIKKTKAEDLSPDKKYS
jgi:hypothetical protein